MLKFGGPKFWLCAVNCVRIFSLPRPSFGLRVQYLRSLSTKYGCMSNVPFCVQKAGYTGGYRGGYGNKNIGFGGRPRSQGDNRDDLSSVKYENLDPIKKDLYKEHRSVSGRSQSEIDEYLQGNQVNLDGQDILRPVFKFDETGFPEPILKALSKFDKPTVIQAVSWPLALGGKDIISIARTGSGKTLGFVLPAITHVINQPSRSSKGNPAVLIVLPTRELCQQVAEVAKQYCGVMNLNVGCVYGGAPKGGQAEVLRKGVDLLVGTPGRLMDFLDNDVISLRSCSFLVMDEADRMLDMGFEPQIRKIVQQIRPDRQTLMFSATWPREVQKLAADFQTKPVFLNVGSMELAANHNIKQHVEVVEPSVKRDRLFQILQEVMIEADNKTIVFVNLKSEIERLTREMRTTGFPALAIHGDKRQKERDFVLSEFRSGRTKILVATDVAARGLDVNDVKVVINYDYPVTSEDYVHRIGRTGRGEKTGVSYTFFTNDDGNNAADLIKVLEESKQDVPEALRQTSSAQSYEKKKSRSLRFY